MSKKLVSKLILGMAILSLQGCMVFNSWKNEGQTLMFIGGAVFILGSKLATKTNLEGWAMKFLIIGIIVFLAGCV